MDVVVAVGVDTLLVHSGIVVLRSGIYLYACHTGNRTPIIR